MTEQKWRMVPVDATPKMYGEIIDAMWKAGVNAAPPPKLSDERILELTHGCAPNLILDPILFARAIMREILGGGE